MKPLDDTRWVPADGLPPRALGPLLMMISIGLALVLEVGLLGGTSAIVRALEFKPRQMNGVLIVNDILIVWLFGVIAPMVAVLSTLNRTQTRIGVGKAGLRLISLLQSKEVPWDRLRPSETPPSRQWVLFRFGYSEWRGPISFWASKEQARAILSHPDAPRGLFPPEYWNFIGEPRPSE